MARAVAAVAALLSLAACSHDVTLPPPTAPPDNAAARADAAQRSLITLQGVLDGSDVSAAASLAAPNDPGLITALAANARALGASRVSLQYVDADLGDLTAASRRQLGPSAWVASVEVAYRLRADTGVTRMEMAFTFVRESSGVRIAAIGGYGDHSALWLRGPVRVINAGRTTVIDATPTSAAQYSAFAQHAVRDVNLVLRHWRGHLFIEVPATEAELDSVLDAQPATYANIAAVTTTADGSLIPGAPVHVFVNPSIFATLKPKGAQVVLSHESTHVATQAPFAVMPTWLLEGFADYVALDHAGVPVQTAAAQVLARIRKDGLPSGLPTATDLSPTASGLGATYEEAWLACRYLGATYGESKMIAFYYAVDHGTGLGRAFHAVLGVSQQQFVSGWRHDLAGLAGLRP